LIRVGTRGSDLALRQTTTVAQLLNGYGHETKLVVIKTSGDATDRPFKELEGKAFFTKELDEALLDRSIDLAIHSLKDLPTDDPPGLSTSTVMRREDPRDLLLVRKGVAIDPASRRPLLGAGKRLGTSSARRCAQLAAAFPKAEIVDLRGNVPTRVKKLRDGHYDAIVLAAAGLSRLGLDLSDLTVFPLDPPEFLPAPGQGVLAVRYRADDRQLPDALRPLIDPDAAECARAERLVLARLDGGCSLPLGALARRVGGHALELLACLETEGRIVRAGVRAANASEAADAAIRALLGAPAVVVTRPSELDDELVAALTDAGYPVVRQPAIRFAELPRDPARAAILARLSDFDVVAFTSRMAVRAFARAVPDGRAVRATAAVGPSTAHELAEHGFRVEVCADGRGGESLAHALANALPPGSRLLHPGPAEPEPAFTRAVAASGLSCTELPLYATLPTGNDPALPEGAAVVVLASPSAARSFLARPGVKARLARDPASLELIAGGATTAKEVEQLGARVAAVARSPAVADLLAALKGRRENGKAAAARGSSTGPATPAQRKSSP
jgi:hydroxymethylbilane synthase